jgi:hypothetical protein
MATDYTIPKEEYRALLAENAKLRGLVRILKNCADECGDCDTCPINGESGVLNPWLGCDSLRDRMRELGIEAEE